MGLAEPLCLNRPLSHPFFISPPCAVDDSGCALAVNQKGSGLVKARATFSDTALLRTTDAPMQMDTVRNRRFSGTRLRQGQEANSRLSGSLLMPRTRWVTGAGPLYHARKKRKRGCASKRHPNASRGGPAISLEVRKRHQGIVYPIDRSF